MVAAFRKGPGPARKRPLADAKGLRVDGAGLSCRASGGADAPADDDRAERHGGLSVAHVRTVPGHGVSWAPEPYAESAGAGRSGEPAHPAVRVLGPAVLDVEQRPAQPGGDRAG